MKRFAVVLLIATLLPVPPASAFSGTGVRVAPLFSEQALASRSVWNRLTAARRVVPFHWGDFRQDVAKAVHSRRASVRGWLVGDFTRSVESTVSQLDAEGRLIDGGASLSEQQLLSERLRPVVERFARQVRKSPWRRGLLPLLLDYPRGQRQYVRNLVYSGTVAGIDIDLYLHVWSAQGQTRAHDHGDRLTFIVPLGPGIQAENFEISDQAPLIKGQEVHLRPLDEPDLPAWTPINLVTGTQDIHIVSNRSDEDRVVAELYLGKRTPLTTFVPIYGKTGHFRVSDLTGDDPTFRLHELLLRESKRVEPDEIAEALATIAAPTPAYTSTGEAVLSPDTAQALVEQGATLWRSERGPLVLVSRAPPHSRPPGGHANRRVLDAAASAVLGFKTGVLSAILGVGGGTMLSSVLIGWFGLSPERAATTSNAITVPLGVAGAISFYCAFPSVLDLPTVVLLVIGSHIGIYGLGRWRLQNQDIKRGLIVVVLATAFKYLPLPAIGSVLAPIGPAISLSPFAQSAAYLAAGIAVGLLSVNLGIGGGVALVPILNLVFGHSLVYAAANSISAVPFISLLSSASRRRLIAWPYVAAIAPFGIAGSALGFLLRPFLPAESLRTLYGLFLLASGALLLLPPKSAAPSASLDAITEWKSRLADYRAGDWILLQTGEPEDPRYVLGRIADYREPSADQPGALRLSGAIFAGDDFSAVDGEVTVPVHQDALPPIVEGFGRLMTPRAYLRTLPAERARRIREAYFRNLPTYKSSARILKPGRAKTPPLNGSSIS